jgi:glutamyl-tRNA reductase
VVSSTGAAGLVIGVDAVREAVRGRDGRPLFLLDLAVPRDVDPAAAGVPGVMVADLDDLAGALAARAGGLETTRAVEEVRRIVAEEVHRFSAWRRTTRLAPLIHALRERGARIQAAELARFGPRLEGLDQRQRAAVEALAESIVAKLLHQPTARLKELAGPGDPSAQALAALFGLELPPPA